MQLCGREFGKEAISEIGRILSENPLLSRRALSLRVCELLQWKSPNGKLKEVGCRKALLELHRRNPHRAQLDKQMGAMTEKLVAQYAANSDYRSIRMLLRTLAACYPDHPLIERWETQLRGYRHRVRRAFAPYGASQPRSCCNRGIVLHPEAWCRKCVRDYSRT